jgi:hypothetical protein
MKKNFKTQKIITILLYHAGIKPAFKVVINTITRGKHIPHLRNALNENGTSRCLALREITAYKYAVTKRKNLQPTSGYFCI